MKTLTVATEVQKAVFEKVIMNEFSNGFWRSARPTNHAESWAGVEVRVGLNLGPSGFTVPRKYNFVNPEFLKKHEKALLLAAQSVSSGVTHKQLKKQLVSLGLIVSSRLTEIGGTITKLRYTKSANAQSRVAKVRPVSVVRKAAAIFADVLEE